MPESDSSVASVWRLDVLARRRAVLLWTALAVFVVAVAFVLGLPAVYRTSATLLVEGTRPEGAGRDMAGDPGGRLQVIKQEALGRAQLGELLSRFDLHSGSGGTLEHERAITQLRSDIRVDPVRDQMSANGGVIAFSVSYVGRDPEKTADVTNAVAAFFVEQNDEIRSGQSSRAMEVLESEIAETRARLDSQQGQVRSYSARNVGALPQQVEASLAAIARLDAQLRVNGTERPRLMERRQAAIAERARLGSVRPDVDDATLRGQLARLEADLADVRGRYGDTYPDVRRLQAQVVAARAAVAAEPAARAAGRGAELSQMEAHTRTIAEIDEQLDRLETENGQLRERVAVYERRVDNMPANAPALEGLTRDYQATRDRLDLLQRRYDEARLNERAERGGAAEQFRVLDAAVAPAAAAGPSRPLLAALGLALALFCGVVAAVVTDRVDTSFHSVDDLRMFTAVPVLASIPELPQHRTALGVVGSALRVGGGAVAIALLGSGAFYLASAGDQISRVLSRVL